MRSILTAIALILLASSALATKPIAADLALVKEARQAIAPLQGFQSWKTLLTRKQRLKLAEARLVSLIDKIEQAPSRTTYASMILHGARGGLAALQRSERQANKKALDAITNVRSGLKLARASMQRPSPARGRWSAPDPSASG